MQVCIYHAIMFCFSHVSFVSLFSAFQPSLVFTECILLFLFCLLAFYLYLLVLLSQWLPQRLPYVNSICQSQCQLCIFTTSWIQNTYFIYFPPAFCAIAFMFFTSMYILNTRHFYFCFHQIRLIQIYPHNYPAQCFSVLICFTVFSSRIIFLQSEDLFSVFYLHGSANNELSECLFI